MAIRKRIKANPRQKKKPSMAQTQVAAKVAPQIQPVELKGESSRGIRFNPDKTVDVQYKDKPVIRLSRDEYKTSQGGSGMVTPNVKLIQDLQKEKEADLTLKKEIDQKSARDAAIRRYIDAAEAKSGEQTKEVPTFEELQKQNPAQTPFEQSTQAVTEQIADVDLNDPNAPQKIVGEALIGGVDFAKQIYENVRALTGLGGRDTGDVKQAKEIVNSATTLFNEEIARIAAGEDPTEAEEALSQMIKANNKLLRTAKERNIGNLVYWGSRGKDLEEEAVIQQGRLKNLLLDLNEAKMQGKIARLGLSL